MRYAVGKISLAVVVGVGVSASWLSAQPSQPTSLRTRDARGMVFGVQWSRRDIDADYASVFKGANEAPGLTPAMRRCYQKCMEQVYDDDKLIRRDTFRKCVNAHMKMPDGCEEW
jgi:hypothetical protein